MRTTIAAEGEVVLTPEGPSGKPAGRWAGVPQDPRVGTVERRIGEVRLEIRTSDGRRAIIYPGAVTLPVFGNGGRFLFLMRFEVLVGDKARVERGRQEIIPIAGGVEPTAKVIQREAQIGSAWKEAVRALTIVDDRDRRDLGRVAELAIAHRGEGRRGINQAAELSCVAEVVKTADSTGRKATTSDIQRALSKHRGSRVSSDVARRRKMQARRAGLLNLSPTASLTGGGDARPGQTP